MASHVLDQQSMAEMAKKMNSRDNPYELPAMILWQGTEFNGAPLPVLPMIKDPVGHVKKLIAMEVKEDDVFILAYPKCGTHWIWEVVQMLLNQTSQYEKRTKEFVMMDMANASDLEAEKSPRVLNSHLFMCHLPAEIVAKKAKIVHLVRNPKDTIVSSYHHMKQIPKDGFDFWNFVRAQMDNALMVSSQFDFLRQMSEFEKSHPDHPIMHLHYENMKKDPVKGVKDLAEFLQVPASDQLVEEIASACSFDKMKKVDETTKESPEFIKDIMKKMQMPHLKLYRKGTIGDWKNHFTVAQNEIFEDYIKKETEKGLNFKFIYE